MTASLAIPQLHEIRPGTPFLHFTRIGVAVCDPALRRMLYSNERATELLRCIAPTTYGRSPQLPKILADYCRGLRVPTQSKLNEQDIAGHIAGRLICAPGCIIQLTGFAISVAPQGNRQGILLLLEKEEAAAESVPAVPPPTPPFTGQQRKVLTFLREGLGNKEIAARLSLSEYTVKDHLKRIMKKMNCTSRIAIVAKLSSIAPIH